MNYILNSITLILILILLQGCSTTRNTCEDDNPSDYQESVEYYTAKMEKEGETARGLYSLGMSYYKLKSYKAAINAFNKAVKINPNYMEAYSGLGVCNYFIGDKAGICKAFSNILRLGHDPEIFDDQPVSAYIAEHCD